jgi:hypothetical protein
MKLSDLWQVGGCKGPKEDIVVCHFYFLLLDRDVDIV